MLDRATMLTAKVGFDVKVQMFEWLSVTAQSTSVSVSAKSTFAAESTEKVPFDPTWPPCGHAFDPEIGTALAITRLAEKRLESIELSCSCPSEVPKRNDSAP